MTELPYNEQIEDSLKLLYTSDHSDLPPSIFFKPENPLIFKPSETTIYICITPKGSYTKNGIQISDWEISKYVLPLFMKYNKL